MEVARLSSRGVSSISNAPPILARAARSSTTSVAVPCHSSPLFLRSEFSPSPSTSTSYRSSIWSATSLHYGSSFGAVTLLLLAPEVLENQAERSRRRNGSVRAYMETNNPVKKFLNRVQGALPVVGLISRLLSPEGGVGTDRIRFEEFCTRVGRNSTLQDSSAFYRIAAKYGKVCVAI